MGLFWAIPPPSLARSAREGGGIAMTLCLLTHCVYSPKDRRPFGRRSLGDLQTFARSMGLEPTTFRVTGGCSNQLSYDRKACLRDCSTILENEYFFNDKHFDDSIAKRIDYQFHKIHQTILLCRREDLHLRPWVYESHALTT